MLSCIVVIFTGQVLGIREGRENILPVDSRQRQLQIKCKIKIRKRNIKLSKRMNMLKGMDNHKKTVPNTTK